MKELHALVQEIVEFGDVISYAEDVTDPNFQNACQLFSQYLDWRFEEVKQQVDTQDLASKGALNTSDLESLDRLMSAPRRSAEACIYWTRDLFQYCTELQRSKLIAA